MYEFCNISLIILFMPTGMQYSCNDDGYWLGDKSRLISVEQ